MHTQSNILKQDIPLYRHDIKDIAAEIRRRLKNEYPGFKFSITIKRYSGGQSLNCAVLSGSFLPFKDSRIRAHSVNQYWLDTDDVLNNDGLAMAKRIVSIISEYNYDNSDPMTDYFDTNFYYGVSFGSWNRTYRVENN